MDFLKNIKNELFGNKFRKAYLDARKEIISSMIKIDNSGIPKKPDEIRLFAIMRNESLRLPYFIEYYKKIGVDRFFIIDNNSSDQSIEICLKNNNIHVFKTDCSYKSHWFWMEHLLDKYGLGHWCMVVDIDEIFSYPYADKLSLQDLCKFLDKFKYTAVRSLLLDMYSAKSIESSSYLQGDDPLKSVNYFDLDHYEISFPYFDTKKWEYFDSVHYTGGARERVFGRSTPITSLNKFSLFKNSSSIYLGQGMHAINGSKNAHFQGVVFHTKFLNDAIDEANEESIREQHHNNAAYYKDFKKKFDLDPHLSFYCEKSIMLENMIQLVDLGIMRTEPLLDLYVKNNKLNKT